MGFIKLEEDYMHYGLKPIELLIYCQIASFINNGQQCYISDKQLAEQFNVSESTVSRAITELEQKKLITKRIEVISNGRKRYITLAR